MLKVRSTAPTANLTITNSSSRVVVQYRSLLGQRMIIISLRKKLPDWEDTQLGGITAAVDNTRKSTQTSNQQRQPISHLSDTLSETAFCSSCVRKYTHSYLTAVCSYYILLLLYYYLWTNQLLTATTNERLCVVMMPGRIQNTAAC